jgi:hypothetical protein
MAFANNAVTSCPPLAQALVMAAHAARRTLLDHRDVPLMPATCLAPAVSRQHR